MALKDTLASFFDNIDLKETFRRVAADPATARKPLLDGIERTRTQFAARATSASKAPNKWWQVKNGVVALTVKVKGETFDINGVATNHMPEERFEEFLDKFKAAVEAGEFDGELKNHGNGDAKVRIGKAPTGTRGARSGLSNARSSVTRFMNAGKPLDEVEAAMKAGGKFSDEDIAAALAERR